MDVNVKKCKCLDTGKNFPDNTCKLINESNQFMPVCNVIEEKDLGVTVDQNLNFGSHVTTKIKLVNRNLGFIFRTFSYLYKTIFISLNKSMVRPHLGYASPVWSTYLKIYQIVTEQVQGRATNLVPPIANQCYLYKPLEKSQATYIGTQTEASRHLPSIQNSSWV